jgi:LysR family transcriptional regulator, glycine cleavage system transcriptional activator
MSSDSDGEPGAPIAAPRLPPLGALRCFEAAARLESFTRAAEELHLTHGAISRAVRGLEEDLGTPLFERRSRRVFLTPAGGRLRDATAAAFATIAAVTLDLRRQAAAPPLVFSCEPTLLMRWVIPRLPSFHAAHPEIALHIAAGGGPVPFARDGIDVAIRRDDFAFPAGIASALVMAEQIGPVCSPAIAQSLRDGDPGPAAFLARHPLLHTKTRPEAWPSWAKLSGLRLMPGREQSFEHFYFSLQAAAAGLGIAIGPWALVRQDIAAGILVAPFGFVEDGSAYHLLSPHPPGSDRRIAALLEWLRDQSRESV